MCVVSGMKPYPTTEAGMRMEVSVPVEHGGLLPVPLDLNIDLDLPLDAQEHHQLTPPPSHMLMMGQGQGQGHGEDHIESLSYTHSFLSPFLNLTAFPFSGFKILYLISSFLSCSHPLLLTSHLFLHLFYPPLPFASLLCSFYFSSIFFISLRFSSLLFSVLFSPTPLFSYPTFPSLLFSSLLSHSSSSSTRVLYEV
jgi:hypothetical protein